MRPRAEARPEAHGDPLAGSSAAGAAAVSSGQSRELALATAGPAVAAIYRLVRETVDALEDVAPWARLYDPPRDAEALRRMAEEIAAIGAGVWVRCDELRPKFSLGDTALLDTLELYLAGIQGMLEPDLQRLGTQLAKLRAPIRRDEAEALAELTSDLKGKLASALMAAAANLAGERSPQGIALEPLLFPEKEAERQRTRDLVPALAELVATVRGLGSEIAFADLFAAWRGGAPADPYALAGLSALESRLALLLRPRTRHALYAGDYHELRRRERRLSRRVHEALELQAASWEDSGEETARRVCERLIAASLEIAALVDVELLQSLAGAETVAALRSRVLAGEGGDDLPPELRGVLPLMAEEDLRTFLELLLGSVRKRAALQQVTHEAATAAKPAEPAISAAERLDAARRLDARLQALLGPANPRWSSFRMVGRLLGRGGAIPPELLETAKPFVAEVRRDLAPELDQLARLGPLPPELAESLRDDCAILERTDLSPLEMRQRLPAAVRRLERVLEALRGAIGALAKGSR